MKKTLTALMLTLATPACMNSMSDSASCRTAGLSASQMECQNLSAGAPCSMVTAPSPGGTKTILCWAQGQSQNNSIVTTGSGTTSSTGAAGSITSGSSTTTTGTAPSPVTGSGVMTLALPINVVGMDSLSYNGHTHLVDLKSAASALTLLDKLRMKQTSTSPSYDNGLIRQYNIQFTGTPGNAPCSYNPLANCRYMNFQSLTAK